MMKTVLWVVGEPGVGKTTVVRGLFGNGELSLVQKPKWTVCGSVAAAGHYTGKAFDGADTIPYDGGEAALEYWFKELLRGTELTILDGDRLSNKNAKEYIEGIADFARNIGGLRVACALLVGDSALIKQRRMARSEQNETWVKGRKTKAERFFQTFPDRVIINSDEGPEAVLQQVKAFLAGKPVKLPVEAKQGDMVFG